MCDRPHIRGYSNAGGCMKMASLTYSYYYSGIILATIASVCEDRGWKSKVADR